MIKNQQEEDKVYGPYGLEEVVVVGEMPGRMKRELGMFLHHNPKEFRRLMSNARSDEERRFYFMACYNAARDEVGRQYVECALGLAGIISMIASGGSALAVSTPFLRQGVMMGGRTVLRCSSLATKVSSAFQAAGMRGYFAVSNTTLRATAHLRDIGNITAKMLYPEKVTFSMMMKAGGFDILGQIATNTLISHYIEKQNWRAAGTYSLNRINLVSVGASAMRLPLALHSGLSAGFIYNKIEQKSIFDKISAKQFLFDWATNYTFGKVQKNVSYNFPYKEAAVATGINTSIYAPKVIEPAMMTVYRSLRFAEGFCGSSTNAGLSVYRELLKASILPNESTEESSDLK